MFVFRSPHPDWCRCRPRAPSAEAACKRRSPYPAAQVEAVLVPREDCLLLGEYVVFWPHGTTWDSSAQAVVFVDGSVAPIGEVFKGGGGEYGPDVDFESLIGADAADAVRACLHKTNLSEVVVAAH